MKNENEEFRNKTGNYEAILTSQDSGQWVMAAQTGPFCQFTFFGRLDFDKSLYDISNRSGPVLLAVRSKAESRNGTDCTGLAFTAR